MKTIFLLAAFVIFSAFMPIQQTTNTSNNNEVSEVDFASFSLINDTKEKVSIHTGSGFVSLNKDSKTSITCKFGKEVRWAESGSKKAVIFEITNEMCSKTIKLSKYL